MKKFSPLRTPKDSTADLVFRVSSADMKLLVNGSKSLHPDIHVIVYRFCLAKLLVNGWYGFTLTGFKGSGRKVLLILTDYKRDVAEDIISGREKNIHDALVNRY